MTELTETEIASVDGAIQEWENHGGPIINHLLPAVAHIKAAARAEVARDMRTKIEELADDFHDRSQSHAWPTPSSMAYRDAWRTASTVLRALLADGGEPNG